MRMHNPPDPGEIIRNSVSSRWISGHGRAAALGISRRRCRLCSMAVPALVRRCGSAFDRFWHQF